MNDPVDLAQATKVDRCASDDHGRVVATSIMVSDMFERQCIAMQAAIIAGHLESPEVGLRWIGNTLDGPGLYPDIAEARALGGAQAWFDRETAKLEEFRKAHPAPVAQAQRSTGDEHVG